MTITETVRSARLLPMLLLAACSDGADPSPRGIGGVWTGPVTFGTTTSSLVLWLPDSVGQIEGAAFLRPRVSSDFAVNGTFSGSQLSVEIRQVAPVAGFDLEAELRGDRLEGTVVNGESTVQVQLARATARTDLAGLWVLTSIGGQAVEPGGPDADTLRINEDFRVAITSARSGCAYRTVGIVTQLSGRAAFEYFWIPQSVPCSQFLTWDTLDVTSQRMIRRRPVIGAPFEEIYERR